MANGDELRPLSWALTHQTASFRPVPIDGRIALRDLRQLASLAHNVKYVTVRVEILEAHRMHLGDLIEEALCSFELCA